MRNEANLPTETDPETGKVSLVWRGVSIQDQFPWTRVHKQVRSSFPTTAVSEWQEPQLFDVTDVTLTSPEKESTLEP